MSLPRRSATLLGLAVLCLSSCTAMDVGNTVPFMAHPTTTKEMAVPEAPPRAYHRSITTIMAMGGTITHLQPDTHRISAVVNGAVALNVTITPAGDGSLVSASQHVSAMVMALAPVRVCDQFLAAYWR
jgi:hypothetical protein